MHNWSTTMSDRPLAKCERCSLNQENLGYCAGTGWVDRPDIMFIAEAPGEQEVRQGVPLIGKAGQFFRMVARDQGIDLTKCYLTNACLCRPPGKRPPKMDEVKACRPRLLWEIKTFRPKLIVTMGAIATSILGFRKGITHTHGIARNMKLGDLRVPVLPTYHPSGVLRNPEYYLDFEHEFEVAKSVVGGEPILVKPPYENYKFVTTQRQFDWFVKVLATKDIVALDLETDTESFATGRILCAGFSWKRESAYVIDWEALLEQNIDNLRALDAALVNVRLSFQNGLYDVPFLFQSGFKNVNYYFDTMLAHFLTDERQRTHGLERLATWFYRAPDYKTQFRRKLGISGWAEGGTFRKAITKVGKKALFRYNGADTDYTYRLTEDLARMIEREGQSHILHDIEIPAAKLFTELYMEGMVVDRNYLDGIADKWKADLDELDAQIKSYPKAQNLNVNSPKQLAAYMYDELGLLPFGGKASFKHKKIDEEVISKCIQSVNDPEAREYWTSKRTQMSESMSQMGTGGLAPRSTSSYMLYWLRQQHEFPGLLIKRRTLNKKHSMYHKSLLQDVWSDSRVRPQYRMTATRTGRKATGHPAIHNLPRGDEIYNIYVAPPGWVILHADYSQAEMRMMAHYSQDKDLIHLLNTIDIHTKIAKEIFKLSDKEWDALDKTRQKNMRIASKMICMTVDQRVLTARLKWKPVGQLVVGEKLIAFDEEAPGFGKKRRHWLIADVTCANHEIAEAYRVYLSNGTTIDTTAEHRWLTLGTAVKGGRRATRWVKTRQLRKGNYRPTRLPYILPVWEETEGKLAGYIQGIFDDEGSLSKSGKELGFTQQKGQVFIKTVKALRKFGVIVNVYDHHKGHDDVKTVKIAGGFAKILEFLGRFRSIRLLNNLSEGDMPTFTLPDRESDQWVAVVKVEPLGKREIVVLSTSSRTLFGEGYAMGNSFGIPYGRSAAGLAPQLGISKGEAARYMEVFFGLMPGLEKWLIRYRKDSIKSHRAYSVMGRCRRFPLVVDKYHRHSVEKQAGNMPIQSAINDLTLIAYIKSVARLREAGIPVKPHPHIHDSFNVIVPKPLWKPAVQIINDVMVETPFETNVAFPVEIEMGERWGSCVTVMNNGKWTELANEKMSAL